MLVAGQECGGGGGRGAGGGRRARAAGRASGYAEPVAEDLALLLQQLAPAYQAILAASTTHGKNVMPRLAALLDVAQLSDIVEVLGPDTFKRYIYAGNASPRCRPAMRSR